MVTVSFHTILRKEAGEKECQSQAGTVKELLDELSGRYGATFSQYLKNCIVFVNGRNAAMLRGKKTKLKPGDNVSLFPPVAGG